MNEPDLRQRRITWENHYLDGRTPWDTGITPPEVRTFWRSGLIEPSGIALDMGCGAGTNAAFLAAQGLHVLGIELSHTALAKAQQRNRSRPAAVSKRVCLIQGDVSRPPLASAGAVYALDIGCLHAIPRSLRPDYATALVDNMAPGAYYHLFAHDRIEVPNDDGENERGLDPEEVEDLFAPALTLLTVLRGNPEPRPCRWYLLYKPE